MNSANLTVKTRLIAAFGALTCAVLLIAGVSIKALSDANNRFILYVDGVNARATLSDQVRTAVDRRAIAARNMVLVTTSADLQVENTAVLKAHTDVQERLSRLTDMVRSGPGSSERARDLVAEMSRVEQLYGPVALDIVKMASEQRKEEAAAKINTECRPLLAQLIAAASAYRSYTADKGQSLLADAQKRYANQRALLIAICAMAIAAAAAAGMLITRSLTRALGAEPADLGRAAQRIAAGDLQPIAGAAAARSGNVLASLGSMQLSLAGIVGDVRQASDSIANGSAEIASGNADLSQRTEEQASALQETAATMEELGTTVRHNADSARQASGLATSAASIARTGGDVVGRVVSTMKDINDSSRKVGDIIAVIDSIVFQTSILALKLRVPANKGGVLRSWPPKCVTWHEAAPTRPKKSRL